MYFYSPLLLTSLNLAIACASLFLLFTTVAILVDNFFYQGRYLSHLLDKFVWPLIILLTVSSVAMSLLYSEYFGFIPCSLCWLQRIAVYPQALLSLIAYKNNDYTHFPIYGIALSIFGLLVAVYQYVYQMLPSTAEGGVVLPCLVDGSGADCATKVIDQFGFVTFPFVSAVTFALLIVLYLHVLRVNKQKPTELLNKDGGHNSSGNQETTKHIA